MGVALREAEALLDSLLCCCQPWWFPGPLGRTLSTCQGYKQTRQLGSEAKEGDKLADGGGENFLTWEDGRLAEGIEGAWEAGGEWGRADGVAGVAFLAEKLQWEKV